MCYVLVFCCVGHAHCVPFQAFICPGSLWCCAVPNAPPFVQTSDMFSLLRMKHSCLVFHPSECNLLPTSLVLCFFRPRSFFFPYPSEVNPFQFPRFLPLPLSRVLNSLTAEAGIRLRSERRASRSFCSRGYLSFLSWLQHCLLASGETVAVEECPPRWLGSWDRVRTSMWCSRSSEVLDWRCCAVS